MVLTKFSPLYRVSKKVLLNINSLFNIYSQLGEHNQQ